MTLEDLVRHFVEASISGASKTQVVRKFKETYNLNQNQIKKLENLAKFKKNLKINYKEFYKNNIIKKLKEYTFLLLNYINMKIFYQIKNVKN